MILIREWTHLASARSRSRLFVRCRAFTIAELLVSIALVLILILGVNAVFRMGSETVGAGQAVSSATRDARAAQAVFAADFRSAVTGDEKPFFMIRSRRESAFLNRADAQSDRDYDALLANAAQENTIRTWEPDGVTTQTASVFGLNRRSHRVDILRFFTRGLFVRQTGYKKPAAEVFVAQMTGPEAYVTYGHLKLPNNASAPVDGDYFGPGPDWHEAIAAGHALWNVNNNPNNFYASQWVLGRSVLVLAQPDTSNQILDKQGQTQLYIGRASNADTQTPFPLSPLSINSQTTWGGATYSMADPKIEWSPCDLAGTTISTYRSLLRTAIYDKGITNWWGQRFSYRFWAKPWINRPLNSDDFALTAPIFLVGCSQFLVEFAGDYVTQEQDSGVVTAPVGDGIVDFQIQGVSPNITRTIRWYGLPRDIDGDGHIRVEDIVPLRDIRGSQSPFERSLPTATAQPDYYGLNDPAAEYICAWGPDTPNDLTPRMIRITLTLDEPAGRMGEGQMFEFIYELP